MAGRTSINVVAISDDKSAELRGQVLAGYASKAELAAASNRHIRTIDRWKTTLNVPTILVGGVEFLSIEGLRRALTGQPAPVDAPVKRSVGRPRKATAAATATATA
jgi:hypothetical protein